MNPVAEDFVDILAASGAPFSLVAGTNLFAHQMPEAPNACVSVKLAPGGSRDVHLELHRPMVQIRIRGEKNKHSETEVLAEAMRDYLAAEDGVAVGGGGLQINGTRYIGIWPQGDILPLGGDDNSRPVYTVNLRVYRTPAT